VKGGPGIAARAAMLERLDQYAALRDRLLPVDAVMAMGISQRTGERYERWYRRERLRLPDRRRGGWRIRG
jgi:hypothetical protein